MLVPSTSEFPESRHDMVVERRELVSESEAPL
jgi:hypothetical protein